MIERRLGPFRRDAGHILRRLFVFSGGLVDLCHICPDRGDSLVRLRDKTPQQWPTNANTNKLPITKFFIISAPLAGWSAFTLAQSRSLQIRPNYRKLNFFESVCSLAANLISQGNKTLIQKTKGEIIMRSIFGLIVVMLAVGFGVSSVSAQMKSTGNPMVGGAAMYKTKDIIDNAVNSADHTTLVAAVKAAGLVETLKGAGPFTVFAPVNSAFDKLPAGTVEMLLKPENKAMLVKILTYHVVSGNWDSKAIAGLIKKGKGKAEITAVSGGKLWASMDGMTLVLTDEKGGTSRVTIADVRQSNGIIHVVDSVLLPN